MIFDSFEQKFQKNENSDETLLFLDLFGELEGAEKYPPDHFAPFPTLKTIKNL